MGHLPAPLFIHSLRLQPFASQGLKALEAFATKDSWARLARLTAASSGSSAGMYLAYAAAAALLTFLTEGSAMVLRQGTLEVEVVGTSAHCLLDAGVSPGFPFASSSFCVLILLLLPVGSAKWIRGRGTSRGFPCHCCQLPCSPHPYHHLCPPTITHAGSIACLEILPPEQPNLSGGARFGGACARGGDGGRGQGLHPNRPFRPTGKHRQHRSLVELMGRTVTSAGSRLLRATLLQPLTSPEVSVLWA